jgi:hypothetical protein
LTAAVLGAALERRSGLREPAIKVPEGIAEAASVHIPSAILPRFHGTRCTRLAEPSNGILFPAMLAPTVRGLPLPVL